MNPTNVPSKLANGGDFLGLKGYIKGVVDRSLSRFVTRTGCRPFIGYLIGGMLCAITAVSCDRHRIASFFDDSISLSLAVPSDPGSDEWETFPWISMSLSKPGRHYLYFSRDAEFHGLVIEIRDSAGALVPLNEHGKALAIPKRTSTAHRSTYLGNGKPQTFDIALGEGATLQPDRDYSVRVNWTLSVYMVAPINEATLDKEGSTVTVTSNILKFHFERPPKSLED